MVLPEDMSKYYYTCDECSKPTLSEESHVIVENNYHGTRGVKATFCNACWASVMADPNKILKKYIRKNNNNNNNKNKNGNNVRPL